MTEAAKEIDLDKVSSGASKCFLLPPTLITTEIYLAEASRLMSEEHKNLGYRPPPDSLAARAQSAASKHSTGFLAKHDISTLRDAAKEDAERIMKEQGQHPGMEAARGGIDPRRFSADGHHPDA